MDYIPERWGEKTILRVEDSRSGRAGMELILRLRRDVRAVDADEIVGFLEEVIKEVRGKESELQKVRQIRLGHGKNNCDRTAWKRTHREKLSRIVMELSETLTERGRKNLAQCLVELAGHIEK